MSVVTISRGTFSGGKMLAECLADKLGYRCIDREVIVEKAAAGGVSQEDIRDALQKPPSFLDRFKHKKYIYLALIQAALAEEVRTGKAVYHGNAGHLLLEPGPPVLRTRIIAPVEFRVKMAQERLKLNGNEARSYIQKQDSDRQKWTHYLYGVDWGDPHLYDIVINLEYVDLDQACQIITTIVGTRAFEFTPKRQEAMNDLALASRIRANLALDPATEDLEVKVFARQGTVRIKGRLSSLQQINEVKRVVNRIPGVRKLNLDDLAPAFRGSI